MSLEKQMEKNPFINMTNEALSRYLRKLKEEAIKSVSDETLIASDGTFENLIDAAASRIELFSDEETLDKMVAQS
ncbi:hypothetical protein [Pseudemcibacter aquimaris]|uniref:hypothetical protein n=1 Tax=Pseudemcibacter aquimaris TaxID=2857064 RepID=UPI00201244A3|nr:hypothetical protein [Pseudemcibacter aquimaris]MCC3859764.1 hypothetical protein [Pseudemcibacter aquimaris]WDU60158.1 hypothetical protein KW060_07795 [Pseudemcibacter aquimaris]